MKLSSCWVLEFHDDGPRGVVVVESGLPIGETEEYDPEDLVEEIKYGLCEAVLMTNRLGINPGGHVAGTALPVEMAQRIPYSLRERVLTYAEADDLKALLEKEES